MVEPEAETTVEQTQSEEKPAEAKVEAVVQPAPSQSEDIKRALDAAQRIAADAARSGEAYQKTIQALISTPSKEEPVEAEPEIPDEFKPVVSKLERLISQNNEQLGKRYEQDRRGDFEYRARTEEERAVSRYNLNRADSPVTIDEVREQMKLLPPEQRVAENYDWVVAAIRGKKVMEAERIEAGRASSLASSARSAGASDSPSYTPEERAFITQRVNPSFSDDDAKVLRRGPTSIEDYKKSRKVS